MKRFVIISLLGAAVAAGCDTNAFPWSRHPPGGGAGVSAGGGRDDTESRPYTILLCALTDPETHVADAERYRKTLTEKVGWKDLFVVHKGGRSELFWGRYRSGEAKEAQDNLKTAKAYRTKDGIPLFVKAIVYPIPGKEIGPKEWNLKGAKGEHSLLVAVFKDDPERNYVGRRRFAVQYCRRLRQHRYEAYFHHGPVNSHVTIGAFGHKAIRIQKTPTGQKLYILDPAIKQLQKDFPLLAINGSGVIDHIRDPRTGKMIRHKRKTYLIRIPHGEHANATKPKDRPGLAERR